MHRGLSEAKIGELDLAEDQQHFSQRERLAIRFAEKMAVDHHFIDDAFVEALRSSLSDAEIAEVGMMIGQYIGFGSCQRSNHYGSGGSRTCPGMLCGSNG